MAIEQRADECDAIVAERGLADQIVLHPDVVVAEEPRLALQQVLECHDVAIVK